jgi:hypothetical protein
VSTTPFASKFNIVYLLFELFSEPITYVPKPILHVKNNRFLVIPHQKFRSYRIIQTKHVRSLRTQVAVTSFHSHLNSLHPEPPQLDHGILQNNELLVGLHPLSHRLGTLSRNALDSIVGELARNIGTKNGGQFLE